MKNPGLGPNLNPRTDDDELNRDILNDDMDDAEERHRQEHEEDFLTDREREDREAFADEYEDEDRQDLPESEEAGGGEEENV